MKYVYFVRHGESEENIGSIYEGANSRLTNKGYRQSILVAKKYLAIPIEVIISSTMIRAKETALVISEITKIPIEYSKLFCERRRPSDQFGQQKNSNISLKAEKTIRRKFANIGFRYSDEENVDDLIKRAKKVLSLIRQRPEKNILIVTHGFFLKIILATALFDFKSDHSKYIKFINKKGIKNAGTSILSLRELKSNSLWRLLTWNNDFL